MPNPRPSWLTLAAAAAPLFGQGLQTLNTPLAICGTITVLQAAGAPYRRASFTATGTATVAPQFGSTDSFAASGTTGVGLGDLKRNVVFNVNFSSTIASRVENWAAIAVFRRARSVFRSHSCSLNAGISGTGTITGGAAAGVSAQTRRLCNRKEV